MKQIFLTLVMLIILAVFNLFLVAISGCQSRTTTPTPREIQIKIHHADNDVGQLEARIDEATRIMETLR